MPSIMAHATDLPLPPNFGDGTSKLTQDTSPSEPKQSGSSQSGERKVPKWLKVGLSMRYRFVHAAVEADISLSFTEK